MNYKEFENKFNKINLFDRCSNYFKAIIAVLGGFYFLYILQFSDWYELENIKKEGKMFSKNVLYFIIISFIVIGLYGFWRIPFLYKVSKIKANPTFEQNVQLVKDVAKSMGVDLGENAQNYYSFRYTGKFWNRLDIYFFIEDEYIYLNVQQVDISGGFIDFGTSKKVKNKILNKIALNTKK